MSVERCGHFIKFRGDDGVRYLARVASVQLAADVDEMAAETYLTVSNKTILIRAPLEEVERALLDQTASEGGYKVRF